MLLNQAQYKEHVKILNKIAEEITDLITKTKKEWDSKDSEEKDSLQRGIHMGKLGALNTCLQLFRNKADGAYKIEMDAADLQVLNQIKQIENQCLVLSDIAQKTTDTSAQNLILDQVSLFEAVIKELKLILRQVGTKNA